MATVTLNIPDAQLPRLVAAVAQQRGIDTSGMNAGQKAAMVKQDITNYLINVVQASEIPTAQATATAAKIADITANVTVT